RPRCACRRARSSTWASSRSWWRCTRTCSPTSRCTWSRRLELDPGAMLCVQYGCGTSTAEGWRNFDASPTLRFERIPVVGRLYSKNGARFPGNAEYGDIVKGLPIADGSCDAVYCSHVLEHLALDDLHVALANTLRIVKPGGVFRLVVPDLEVLAR